MKTKSLLVITSLTTFFVSTQVSLAENTMISLTLNGKDVKAISVDKLGALNFKVTSAKTFKQVYANQWGKLDNALIVVSKIFKKGAEKPDLSKTYANTVTELANTYSDSGWGSQKSATKPMLSIAKNNEFFSANTSNSIAIGVRFSRKEYTGKTIWKNGGWVDETRWVDVGPVLASTVLSLEEPPFANKVDWDSIMQQTVDSLNTEKQDPSSSNNSTGLSKFIFDANSFEAKDYEGSKTLSAEKNGTPLFSWNYDGDEQLVSASLPVALNIHAVKKNGFFGGTEADFKCGHAKVVTSKYFSKDSFEKGSLEIDSDFTNDCTTKDGKKGKDFGGNSSSGSAPSAMDLINGALKEVK